MENDLLYKGYISASLPGIISLRGELIGWVTKITKQFVSRTKPPGSFFFKFLMRGKKIHFAFTWFSSWEEISSLC